MKAGSEQKRCKEFCYNFSNNDKIFIKKINVIVIPGILINVCKKNILLVTMHAWRKILTQVMRNSQDILL